MDILRAAQKNAKSNLKSVMLDFYRKLLVLCVRGGTSKAATPVACAFPDSSLNNQVMKSSLYLLRANNEYSQRVHHAKKYRVSFIINCIQCFGQLCIKGIRGGERPAFS